MLSLHGRPLFLNGANLAWINYGRDFDVVLDGLLPLQLPSAQQMKRLRRLLQSVQLRFNLRRR